MINIQSYLDKLEVLKEYMDGRIDNQPMEVWMDLQVCQNSYYEENDLPLPKPYKKTVRFFPHTFESFIEQKTS